MAGKHSKSRKNIKMNKKIAREKLKKERKKKNIIFFLSLIVFLSILIYSLIQIFNWFKDNKSIKNEMEQVNESVTITETTDDSAEVVKTEKKEEKSSPYWDYIKMDLMDVDISELKKSNSDVKGWIKVNGTNINYPFVQTTNNDYYLTHSITKQYNSAGWVYMDYRNNVNSFDKNTVIYAHARVNQYMFGTLKNTLKSSWLNNTDNHVIKLSTEKQNTLWQVFSIYHIPTTNDYIQTDFSTDERFTSFLDLIKNRSIHDFNTSVSKDDKVLTLSTCYGNNEKLVVHAKLIKFSNK